MGKHTVLVFLCWYFFFFLNLPCLIPFLDQISFCVFSRLFFHRRLSHLSLIPLLLLSGGSSMPVCSVLICTFAICCFVIVSHKSFLSLPNWTAVSFQEGIGCVCVRSQVPFLLVSLMEHAQCSPACANSSVGSPWHLFLHARCCLILVKSLSFVLAH